MPEDGSIANPSHLNGMVLIGVGEVAKRRARTLWTRVVHADPRAPLQSHRRSTRQHTKPLNKEKAMTDTEKQEKT